MNEWKEIPGRWVTDSEDIEYKFQFNTATNSHITLYRKIEPKAPTHEEIMTKWWKLGETWYRVYRYRNKDYRFNGMYVPSDFFIGLESADIPPE